MISFRDFIPGTPTIDIDGALCYLAIQVDGEWWYKSGIPNQIDTPGVEIAILIRHIIVPIRFPDHVDILYRPGVGWAAMQISYASISSTSLLRLDAVFNPSSALTTDDRDLLDERVKAMWLEFNEKI